MSREKINKWLYDFKKLPNTQPGFASGLCSMVCLWLVLIPALIMAIKEIKFDLQKLIIPGLGALLLATVLLSAWKKLALKLKDVENFHEN